jgi:hypothetical protein
MPAGYHHEFDFSLYIHDILEPAESFKSETGLKHHKSSDQITPITSDSQSGIQQPEIKAATLELCVAFLRRACHQFAQRHSHQGVIPDAGT